MYHVYRYYGKAKKKVTLLYIFLFYTRIFRYYMGDCKEKKKLFYVIFATYVILNLKSQTIRIIIPIT